MTVQVKKYFSLILLTAAISLLSLFVSCSQREENVQGPVKGKPPSPRISTPAKPSTAPVLSVDNDLERIRQKYLPEDKVGKKPDHKTVISTLNEVLEKDPQNPDVLYFLANEYYNLGSFKEALDYYNRLLNVEPAHKKAIVEKSFCLLFQKKYEEARIFAEEAQKLYPESLSLTEVRIRSYTEQGDDESYNLAKPLIRDSVEKNPQHLPFHQLHYKAHMELGEYDEAEDAVMRGLRGLPDSEQLRLMAGEVYLIKGDPEKTLKYIEPLVRDDKNYKALLLEAESLFLMGRVDEAEEICRRVTAESPSDFAGGEMLMAKILTGKKKYDRALKSLETALAIIKEKKNENEEISSVYLSIADLYVYMGNYGKAEENIKKAREYYPDSERAYLIKADILIAQKEYEKAEKLLHDKLSDPRYAQAIDFQGPAFFRLAKIAAQKGDRNLAKKLIKDSTAKLYGVHVKNRYRDAEEDPLLKPIAEEMQKENKQENHSEK